MKKNEKFVAYYRVSTAKQGESGLGLDAQRSAVATFVSSQLGSILAEFTEIESGKRNDRIALQAALEACALYGARLVIAKLDRLARNVAFTSNLMESGVDFIAVDNPTASRLTIHILAAVAEDEAARISARTKAALAEAKNRGVVLGGRKVAVEHFKDIARKGRQASAIIRSHRAAQRASAVASVIREITAAGPKSLREVAMTLNERGIAAAKGGAWSPTQVRRILSCTS